MISVLLAGTVFLYLGGGVEPIMHGAEYAALSQAPFGTEQGAAMRNRILAPLVGWLVHLRGAHFVWVPWSFLVGFLALVNVWARRLGAGSTLAVVTTVCVAFSGSTMLSLIAPGYVDAVSFFLIGVAFMQVHRKLLSTACLALAVMNHEVSAFMAPAWLLYGAPSERQFPWFRERLVLLVALLLPYATYRWWVTLHDAKALSLNYYFAPQNLKDCLGVGLVGWITGIFAVFRLHWLVVLFVLISDRKAFNTRRLGWNLVLLASLCATLVVAYDSTRLFSFAFPLLVIGSVELGRRWGANRAITIMLIIWGLNFLIPPYTTTGERSYPLHGIVDRIPQATRP